MFKGRPVNWRFVQGGGEHTSLFYVCHTLRILWTNLTTDGNRNFGSKECICALSELQFFWAGNNKEYQGL